MALLTRCFECVMEARDWFRRLDLYRILIAERAVSHAEDESEFLNMPRKVRKFDASLFALAPIQQLECLRIVEQLVARPIPPRQNVEADVRMPAGESSGLRAFRYTICGSVFLSAMPLIHGAWD